MAEEEKDPSVDQDEVDEEERDSDAGDEEGLEVRGGEEFSLSEALDEDDDDDDAPAAAVLGTTRYVMAGFFAAGMLGAFIIGRFFATIWGQLVEVTWFQQKVSVLARVDEGLRGEYTTLLGAAISLVLTIWLYRREDIRQWSDDVATELSKVTWPDKEEVTNSTAVVIATGFIATIYLGLLDRFWGIVTQYVYH